VLLPHNVLYIRESSIKLTYISSLEKCEGLFIKGLKHNLQSKPGKWINNLALEAETAVYIYQYSRTPFTWTLVIWIAKYPDWTGQLGKSVNNSTELTCLEITSYQIKYRTVLWLLKLPIRRDREVLMHVHTVHNNSQTSNCQCSLFSKKNPIIQIFYIAGWLTNPFNSVKCSSTVQEQYHTRYQEANNFKKLCTQCNNFNNQTTW